MKVAYNVYSKVIMFCERRYSVQEINEYINHTLSTSFNEREKLETNRGNWEFNPKLMYQWCKDNNIIIMENPETPDLDFRKYESKWGNPDNTMYDRLIREFYRYR